jgi:hypothetical protein
LAFGYCHRTLATVGQRSGVPTWQNWTRVEPELGSLRLSFVGCPVSRGHFGGVPSDVNPGERAVKIGAMAAAATSIGLLMWVPITIFALILALLVVWVVVAPSEVPFERLERLLQIFLRQFRGK